MNPSGEKVAVKIVDLRAVPEFNIIALFFVHFITFSAIDKSDLSFVQSQDYFLTLKTVRISFDAYPTECLQMDRVFG